MAPLLVMGPGTVYRLYPPLGGPDSVYTFLTSYPASVNRKGSTMDWRSERLENREHRRSEQLYTSIALQFYGVYCEMATNNNNELY